MITLSLSAYLGNMFALPFLLITFPPGVENCSFITVLRGNIPQTSVTEIGRTAAVCIFETDVHVWTVKCRNCGFNEHV